MRTKRNSHTQTQAHTDAINYAIRLINRIFAHLHRRGVVAKGTELTVEYEFCRLANALAVISVSYDCD